MSMTLTAENDATATAEAQYIWPNPRFVSMPTSTFYSPAFPKVESVAACLKKYGPNDWRTWRAQYFENRMGLADEPYRYEHTSFKAALDRGMLCNLWTGTPFPIYGMDAESSRLILYPLTGSDSQQWQSAALHVGQSCEIHSQYASETIMLVWHGSGELYIHDHWIPVTACDIGYAPVGCPIAWRVPEGNKEDMVLAIITAPCPFQEYLKTGLIVKDTSEEGKQRGWENVWKWADPAVTGLLGHPAYCPYPPR
ncbi:MAG: hypothetical protein ACE14M_04090 [Terriglobales bacterium]